MPNIIEGSETALFVQPDPAGEYEPLTCTGIGGDITLPQGELTPVYCPSATFGNYDLEGFIQGAADPVTVQLIRPFESVYNYLLEAANCSQAVRVNWGCPETPRALVTNYLIGLTMYNARPSTRGIVAAGALEPGENARINTTADLSATTAEFIKRLQSVRQTLTQTQDVNDIAMLPQSCGTKCGFYRAQCTEGYAVLDTDYIGAYGDVVLRTTDSGGAWNPTTSQPFTALGRNGSAVKTVVTADGHRVIVAGGAVPGLPPETSYSDDNGALWFNVNPETGAGTGNRGINAMAWDTLLRLWAAADDGRIYVSTDIGASWSVSEAGVETVQDLNDIAFFSDLVGYAVGDSNVVLNTTDGATWDALTGPAAGVNLLSVAVNRFGHVFIGTNDARVFRSTDDGATWTELLDLTAGSVDRIEFAPQNEYIGYLLWNNASPSGTVYRTEDGGATWQPQTMPTATNAGLYALEVCDPNSLFVGGDTVGGTSYIARFTRRTSE